MQIKLSHIITWAILGLIITAGITGIYVRYVRQKYALQNTAVLSVEFSCQDTPQADFDCYDNYYRQLVKQQGVGAAFADLKERFKINTYLANQCHPITHIIGQAATEKYPTVSESFTKGDSFCWSGYYHGVMEGILAKFGHNEVLGKLNSICANVSGKEHYSFDYYNCVHGLGHGLMAYTNNELPKALGLCDLLAGDWEQQSCYNGIFMENVIADGKNHTTKYLKASDPLYPCDIVEKKYAAACWVYQASYMFKLSGYDLSKVIPMCEKVAKPEDENCFQSIGRIATGGQVDDYAWARTTCDLVPSYSHKKSCVIGAAVNFISYHHSDEQAKIFCNSLADKNLSTECLKASQEFMNHL